MGSSCLGPSQFLSIHLLNCARPSSVVVSWSCRSAQAHSHSSASPMELFTCCRSRPASGQPCCDPSNRRAEAFRKAIKILLLGTGESGKSTVLKQMKILHFQGFSDREKMEQAEIIRDNLHDSLCEVLKHLPKLGLHLDPQNQVRAGELLADTSRHFDEVYVRNINYLLQDEAFQACLRRGNEFHLMDNAKYFLQRAAEVSACDYCPSVDDILHSRKITTSYTEVLFQLKLRNNHTQEFRMFDVGGQREERRKWIYVFDGIEALLIVTSCSDFDQTLREDGHTNRLAESIDLFRQVWHNGMLTGAGIICFLNKQDLLEQKIRSGHSIAKHFPDYEQFSHPRGSFAALDPVLFECERTRWFIKEKIIEVTEEPPRRISSRSAMAKRDCYFHFTTATDSDNIRRVFGDVHNMILQQMLSRVELV